MSRNLPNNEEFNALMVEATNGEQSARVMGPRVRRLLEDAAQAGREWADVTLDRQLDFGCYRLAYNWLRSRGTGAFRTEDGRSLSKSRLFSTPVRDPETGDFVGTQLKLLYESSWQELRDSAARNIAQRNALDDTIEMVLRLLRLEQRYPDAYGPAEACARAGITIEDVLTNAEAA